jgi:nucleoid-associated protein YgaU
MQMQVPIVFESRSPDSHAIGPAFATLVNMWRPEAKEGHAPPEPPVVEISSPGDALPFSDLDWVVEDLEWGEAVADRSGNRIQQAFIVTLREYRADERLQTADHAKGKPTKARFYEVRRKDLAHGLVGIAEHLHLKGGWRELGDAQHPRIKDPRKIHVGEKLVIPGTTHTPSWSQTEGSGNVVRT